MIRWRREYDGGRLVASHGRADIGAVFPPSGAGGWRWRMWLTSNWYAAGGHAKTELAAKTALSAAWANLLIHLDLSEAGK